MRLVDSNIVIYAAKPEHPELKDLLEHENIAVSELTRLETLGYHSITGEAEEYFNAVFTLVTVLPITPDIIDKAIQLRQLNNMKAADSIIAATALLYCTDLITRNTKDFIHIPDLIIHNPID